MGMIKRKPGDMNLQQDVRFNWDTFIHNVTNGKYILLLGSEVMLKKDLGDDSCGDNHKAMFNAVRSVLVEDNVLAPNNTADNFTDVNSAVFSPDGKYIVTTSVNGTVRVWPFPPLQELIDKYRNDSEHDWSLTQEEKDEYSLE